MAPESDDPRFPHQYDRILGRLEQKIDGLGESASKRDAKLDELTERVRQNAHTANNAAQVMSNRVTMLETSVKKVDGTVKDLDRRTAALEKPVREALRQRQARRQFWIRVVTVSSGVGIFAWAIAEPIYKALMPVFIKKWLAGE